jgi:hypothetical protein
LFYYDRSLFVLTEKQKVVIDVSIIRHFPSNAPCLKASKPFEADRLFFASFLGRFSHKNPLHMLLAHTLFLDFLREAGTNAADCEQIVIDQVSTADKHKFPFSFCTPFLSSPFGMKMDRFGFVETAVIGEVGMIGVIDMAAGIAATVDMAAAIAATFGLNFVIDP